MRIHGIERGSGPDRVHDGPVATRWASTNPWPAVCGLVLLASIALSMTTAVSAAPAGRQALTTTVLRVCADPANLPFSNRELEGFENRIVALVGDYLGLEVRYTWFPQTVGFVRNTLRLRSCDLISGITTTSELVQNTNPYYHSTYVMLYRADSGLELERMSDLLTQAPGTLQLGVVAGTPPANILAKLGLLAQTRPYHLVADTRHNKPARDAVRDVESGETDVAFLWGPIAAWYAKQADRRLAIVPLLEEDPRLRLNFRVSMAVRYNEIDWKHTINEALAALEDDIEAILRDYDVPLLNDRGELISVP